MLSINEINLLQAQNEGLKKQNKELQKENAKLKGENERLKEENFNFEEIVKLCKCEQYHQTLQEIKAIAKREITYIDFRKSKSCAELEQDYARINYELEQKIFEILQKIAKAEEK